jgi:hypothetical protein
MSEATGISSSDSGSGDNPPAGTNNPTVQVSGSDTGLGSTPASTGGGLVWLLLPAGLLLLLLAIVAALRHRRARS